jgi:DNA-binding response OmpR family regulator
MGSKDLAMVVTAKPDILLLDVGMSVLNGFGVAVEPAAIRN